MRVLPLLIALAIAGYIASVGAVSPDTVFNLGYNDTTGIFPYVGSLHSPDAAASPCPDSVPFGYWRCPVIKIDAVKLGFPSSYVDRLVVTTQFCADIAMPVAGKGYIVSFDYNPDANGAYVRTVCPDGTRIVTDINMRKGNFVAATLIASINDAYGKYPLGMANGVYGQNDLALLLLDKVAVKGVSAAIATEYAGKDAPSAIYSVAYGVFIGQQGTAVNTNGTQRTYGLTTVKSYTADTIVTNMNPNTDGSLSQFLTASPAIVDTGKRNLIGLLSGNTAVANSQAMYQRLDTPEAASFFSAAAAYYNGNKKTTTVASSVSGARPKSASHSNSYMSGDNTTAPMHGGVYGVADAVRNLSIAIWVVGIAIVVGLVVIIIALFLKRHDHNGIGGKRY